MAVRVEYHSCSLCGVQPFNVPTVNHVLHFLLSVFTAGAWVFVWVFLALTKGKARCGSCGLTLSSAYRKAKREYKSDLAEERKAELEASRELFNNRGPEVGSRAKIASGPHKGRFGTVVANDGRNVTIADKNGKRMTLPIAAFRI